MTLAFRWFKSTHPCQIKSDFYESTTGMIETIKQLIKFHTSQGSLLDRDTKDAVVHCILCLFDAMRGRELTEEEWNACIKGNETPLYCWTKDRIEKLKTIKGPVYLCTSLSEQGYNKDCAIFGKPYRHQYVVYLKENAYGIYLNAFNASFHPNEEECLIKLSDIATYKKIN